MNDDERLVYGEWDGLDARDQAALDRRLADEPALREARARATQLRADLQGLGPRGFEPRVPPLDLERLARAAPPAASHGPSPWWIAAAAAVVVGAVGAWWVGGADDGPAPPSTASAPMAAAPPVEAPPVEAPPAPEAPEDITVGFRLRAPDADAVRVAGDFNDWKPESLAMQRGADGLWSVQAALPPGRYAYMYVVDGQWMTPPDARRTQDDGFGARNGVIDLLRPSDV